MPALILSRFRITEYPESSGEVREIYDDVLNYFPFLPNWFKTQANCPVILKGNWTKLKCSLFYGKIPLLLKQSIIYGISRSRNCQYCMAMHSYTVGKLGKEAGIKDIGKLLDSPETSSIPSSWKTAIRLVNQVAVDPQAVNEAVYDELQWEGYNKTEIMELLGLVDLTIMLNTIAEITGIEIDSEIGIAN